MCISLNEFKMANTESLQKLLELAQRQSDESAKKLGRLSLQYQEAEKKLKLLMDYRESYQKQLQDASQNGIDHVEWRNFVTFIKKLDTAIAEQKLAIQYAEHNRKTGNEEYQSCQRKLNSYGTVSQRYQKIKELSLKKLEQKEMDEFASNQFARQKPGTMK